MILGSARRTSGFGSTERWKALGLAVLSVCCAEAGISISASAQSSSVLLASLTSSSTSAATSTSASTSAAVFGPEWIDPRSVLAEDLRLLALRGWIPLRVWTTRPVTRKDAALLLSRTRIPFDQAGFSPVWRRASRELAGELEAFGGRPLDAEVPPALELPLSPGRLRLRPYVRLEGTWEEQRGITWGEAPRIGLAGTAHLNSQFALHEDLFAGRVLGGRRFADALVAHSDFLLLLESVYAGYEGTRLSARAGRLRHSWGPALGGNLLLSADAPPFDHLEYALPLGSFRFQALTGVLSVPEEKNVALHRIEWSPSPRLVLGWAEGAIYSGTPWQPLYLLGLVPYTLVERLHGQDAASDSLVPEVRNNVLWEFDGVWRFRDDSALWGAVLLDDVATESSVMPSRLGLLIGAETAPRRAAGDFRLGFEASKIFQYTYSVFYQDLCACNWSHQGEALGNSEGPDSESLRLYGVWLPEASRTGEIALRWRRKGEGQLGQPWYPPDHPRSVENSGRPAYRLSGVVEQSLGTEIRLRYDPSAAWGSALTVRLDWVRNRDHVRRSARPEAGAELALFWHR